MCVLQSTLRVSPEGQNVTEVGPGIVGGLGSLRVHQLEVELLVLELSGVIPGFMRVRPREEEHCNAHKLYRGKRAPLIERLGYRPLITGRLCL